MQNVYIGDFSSGNRTTKQWLGDIFNDATDRAAEEFDAYKRENHEAHPTVRAVESTCNNMEYFITCLLVTSEKPRI